MAHETSIEEWTPLSDQEQHKRQMVLNHLGDDAKFVTDVMITRFIRGFIREKDPLAKTLEMITNTVKWRREYNTNDLLYRDLARYDEFSADWIHEIHGQDRMGHPITYERVGLVDPASMIQKYSMEFIAKVHVVNMERVNMMKHLISQGTNKGKVVYKTVAIIDLQGLGMKHISRDFYHEMKAMIDIDQFFYPESLYRLFVINAPFIFKMLWAVVKPWIHPLTQQRIHILGGDYIDELKELIDLDQLPAFLGGTCRCEKNDQCAAHRQKRLLAEHIRSTNEARTVEALLQPGVVIQPVLASASASTAASIEVAVVLP